MVVFVTLGVILLIVGELAAFAWRSYAGNPAGDEGRHIAVTGIHPELHAPAASLGLLTSDMRG
jgi:hypothetical protein